MALIKPQVVSQLLVKNQSGYNTPMNIGPELRFCGALPNSGVNNLEEQLLFGTNCVIKEQYNTVDEDEYPCDIITTEYKKSIGDNSSHYKIIKYNYLEPKPTSILVEPANLYAWTTGNTTIYTTTLSPEVGEKVYTEDLEPNSNYNPIIAVNTSISEITVQATSSSTTIDFRRDIQKDIIHAYRFRIDFRDASKAMVVDNKKISIPDDNYIIVNNTMASFVDVPITSLEKLYYISNSTEELISIKTEQVTYDDNEVIRIISISNAG